MSAVGAAGEVVRRHWLALFLAAVALVLLSMPLWLRQAPGGPSAESRAPDGLYGFARLLSSWGARVERVEVSGGSSVPEDGRSLVLAFPTQRSLVYSADWVEDALGGGATVLIGSSGDVLSPEETVFLQELGVELRPQRVRGSLLPWRWWRQQRRGHRHFLTDGGDGAVPLVSDPLSQVPLPSSDCSVLARRAEGRSEGEGSEEQAAAVAIRCLRRGGVLLVAPASVLANDRIAGEGNLRLARRLAADLGDEVTFVEGGAREAAPAPDRVRTARTTLNVIGVHLGLLYLMVLLALARRFGPRWSRPSAPPDAHRAFFLGVGRLHAKLGERRWVAKTLRERWFDWDPMARGRWWEDDEPDEQTGGDIDGATLVQLAQRFSRRGVVATAQGPGIVTDSRSHQDTTASDPTTDHR